MHEPVPLWIWVLPLLPVENRWLQFLLCGICLGSLRSEFQFSMCCLPLDKLNNLFVVFILSHPDGSLPGSYLSKIFLHTFYTFFPHSFGEFMAPGGVSFNQGQGNPTVAVSNPEYEGVTDMMMKKVVGLTIASILAFAGAIPAFAEAPVQNTEDKTVKIEAKQQKAAERLERVAARAAEKGIDTSGMTLEQLKAELLALRETNQLERAAKLGIDISGMTPEEAQAAIQAAVGIMQTERAAKLEISIEGMTIQEARVAIQEAVQIQRLARAEKLGLDISSMTPEDAKAALQAAAQEKLQAAATKFGVDITGKTLEEVRALIKEARDLAKAAKTEQKALNAEQKAVKKAPRTVSPE